MLQLEWNFMFYSQFQLIHQDMHLIHLGGLKSLALLEVISVDKKEPLCDN